jgi:hypothetical protein
MNQLKASVSPKILNIEKVPVRLVLCDIFMLINKRQYILFLIGLGLIIIMSLLLTNLMVFGHLL